MDDELDKKKLKKVIIVVILLAILCIVLYIYNKNNSSNKVNPNQEYIITKETNYSDNENISELPIINLVGEEIDTANEEIINTYYSISYISDNTYSFSYYVYEDILSLFITTIVYDGSTYGDINYYSYNIDLKDNSILTTDELLDKLDINSIDSKIEDHLKSLYNSDDLKSSMNYSLYLEQLNYDESNNILVIDNDTLYCYIKINLTHSIEENLSGNVYQIIIEDDLINKEQ